ARQTSRNSPGTAVSIAEGVGCYPVALIDSVAAGEPPAISKVQPTRLPPQLPFLVTAAALPFPRSDVRTIVVCSRWVQEWPCPLQPPSMFPAETSSRLSARNSDTPPRFLVRPTTRAAKAPRLQKFLSRICKHRRHDRNAEYADIRDQVPDRGQSFQRNTS